jgi:polyisoprenoid-binding protein YceI
VNKLAIVTSVLALAVSSAKAQTSIWIADPAHSEVDFITRRFDMTDVSGRFGRVTGELDLNEADVTRSVVKMTIDLASVDTKDQVRDEHLRSEAFFEVLVFPTATFVSTSVTRNGSSLLITGNLSLHGFTRPVTLNVNVAEEAARIGLDKKLHTKYEATATIKRSNFAIGAAYPNAAIGDEVKLAIKLDTVKKQ